MGASGALTATAFAGSGAASFGGAYAQSMAQRTQGEYQRQQYEFNARMAKLQGEDAIRRGEKTAGIVRREGTKVRGSQRAALAAQGIDVNSGSALDAQELTTSLTEDDARTVKNNAWLEAWGYRVQANDYNFKGAFSSLAANASANNTLLTGGMTALTYGLKGAAAYDKWKTGLSGGYGEPMGSSGGNTYAF